MAVFHHVQWTQEAKSMQNVDKMWHESSDRHIIYHTFYAQMTERIMKFTKLLSV